MLSDINQKWWDCLIKMKDIEDYYYTITLVVFQQVLILHHIHLELVYFHLYYHKVSFRKSHRVLPGGDSWSNGERKLVFSIFQKHREIAYYLFFCVSWSLPKSNIIQNWLLSSENLQGLHCSWGCLAQMKISMRDLVKFCYISDIHYILL